MSHDISNSDDVIDSRDVIERIDYLRKEIADGEDSDATHEELALLVALDDAGFQAQGRNWKDGCTLVRDSYFREYARDLAEDIGAIGKGGGWPIPHIDWDAAADALKVDYTAIEFDDVTYYVR